MYSSDPLYHRVTQGNPHDLQSRFGGHDTDHPMYTANEHRSVALEVLGSVGRRGSLPRPVAEVNTCLAELHAAAGPQERRALLREARMCAFSLGTGSFYQDRARVLVTYTLDALRRAERGEVSPLPCEARHGLPVTTQAHPAPAVSRPATSRPLQRSLW